MSVREIIGFVCLGVGTALLPLGWIINHNILLIASLLMVVGLLLFYTERMHKKQQQLAKEDSHSGSNGAPVSDIHNYTGWQTGGRTNPLESHTSSDHAADD